MAALLDDVNVMQEEEIGWMMEMDRKNINRLAINILKEHRERIRDVLPIIKKTTSRKRAEKKFRLVDYIIGRMIFFDESFDVARDKALIENELGRI
ncbi:hypothetical protein [Pseudalkalibacillus caeni]|uniref:Uncharacterized protein n=1 Tax=Exobacillus caeni TaxID=2574798 RepID=A0A5R9F2B6_9BACL|nr:hypothetical protein [Pseudalkalibacillus caeni]TLS37757.1 hypothetical protein FCL54_08015 [Pseudalkalibacillus caeni]